MANIPPKLTSYTVTTVRVRSTFAPKHVVKATHHARSRSRLFVAPIMIAVILLIGAAGGGYAVWRSEYGKAGDDIVDSAQTAISPRGEPIPRQIPLQFSEADLEIVTNMLPLLISENRHEPTAEEKRNQERTEKLVAFLTKHKSPLAKDTAAIDALLNAHNMKMVLSISFVESNLCNHQQYHNCSGIGGASNFRKYENFGGWIKDMDDLLERRYKNLPVEDFIGVYVQPGSQNWVDGVNQILDELKQGKIE